MAIGAARVMAAGKSGLESLPYFVDELMAQGIKQLAPWAIDHSQDQIDALHRMTQTRMSGPWQNIFGIGISPPGTTMETDNAINRRLVRLINPEAAKTSELADSPAQLGAWCRLQIDQYCRDTERLWEEYKGEKGFTAAYHLAVVIPFCPEGPTSGTVGMYLGAALRKYFADRNKQDQLEVWGIELCPPVDKSDSGEPDRLAVQNSFRGYVARQELLRGVPLSDDPYDDNYHRCFDINIVFDGGTAQSARASSEDVWRALDRAAAQVTACLLNGAGGGDKPEATVQLKQGRRWNAYLAHVVSERSYSLACRYLRYRVALPWHRAPDNWEKASTEDRREAFLRRIDTDIIPHLPQEKNATVKKWVDELVDVADKLRLISPKGKFPFIGKGRKDALKQIDYWLSEAVNYDELNYAECCRAGQTAESIIAKDDLFCINIVLPERQRVEAAVIARDQGIPGPIADVLGAAGISAVRNKITTLCNDVLRRSDCGSVNINSEALYDEVMSISVGDWSRNRSNDQFRPTREVLRYFITEERRDTPGSFSELPYDLSDHLAPVNPAGDATPAPTAALNWNLREVGYDIPVEYSILTLGRVRSGDGFKDISTYEELESNYLDLISDRDRWREHARYYGVKPPPELLPDPPKDAVVLPVSNPGANGRPAPAASVRDNA